MRVKCRMCKTVLNHCPICGTTLNPNEAQKIAIDHLNSKSPLWKTVKRLKKEGKL